MLDVVAKTIEKYSMLEGGSRVCAALSGGADSTALLIALKDLGYDVFAAHINHCLRGEESERDEAFCTSLCKSLGIELFCERVDVRGYCAEHSVSLELGARELRYEALFRIAGESPIATAHNLDDCLETLIFNLTRGAGAHGLASIPPVRGRVIRPLIDCDREAIERFLRERGQSFVTDSTNLVPDCSRNIIRLNVIPELKKINPGLTSGFRSTLSALREADRYIEERAAELLNKRGNDFSGLADDAVLSRAIALYLQRNGIEPSFDRISSAKGIISSGGKINMKKGVYLLAAKGRLSVERDIPEEPERQFSFSEGAYDLSGKRVVVTKLSPFDISRYQKNELRYFVDSDKISGDYTLRRLSGGDKIRLPGRGITSAVKKLLNAEERRTRLIIADSAGPVFVEGIGVSERICCGPDTREALIIDIKEREK